MIVAVLVAAVLVAAASQLPSIAARAIVHPARIVRPIPTPQGCIDHTYQGAEVSLRGWLCRAQGPRRGTLVALHGVADTRASVSGLVRRFTGKGFDVIAYDSRAHGESSGQFCTYGFVEKMDLRRVIDTLNPGPVVLMGTSLGAAVALEAAAGDPRIVGVVGAEVFSDLEAIVRDRAPRFAPDWMITAVLANVERRAGFRVADVSPVRAAASIDVPVLLIHGARDLDTPPDHSKRVLAALRGPKRLILVDAARHNESLRGSAVWLEIENWIDALVATTLEGLT